MAYPSSAQVLQVDSIQLQKIEAAPNVQNIDSLVKLASQLDRAGEHQKAKYILNSVIKAAHSISYQKAEAHACYLRARINLANFAPYDQATIDLLRSLKLYEQIEDTEGMGEVLLQLGVVNYSLGNFKTAAEQFKECGNVSPNKGISSVAQYLLGLSYSELGRYKEARDLLQNSLKNYTRGDGEKEIVVKGFIGKLMINQGNVEEGVEYLEQVLHDYEGIYEKNNYAPVHAFLSTGYSQLEDFDRVIEHAEFVLEYVKIASGSIYYLEAIENIHQAYAEQGEMEKAYAAMMRWRTISDSSSGSKIMERIANEKAKYDFEKEMVKEKAKQDLENALTQQEINRERTQKNVFITSFAVLLFFSLIVFRQRSRISKQKAQSDKLLLNILPEDVAQELKLTGKSLAKSFNNVSILFTDFKDFTQTSSSMSPVELVELVNTCFEAFDLICDKYEIEKIKTIGDSYMAAAGLSGNDSTAVTNAVLAAIDMNDFILSKKSEEEMGIHIPFSMRVGIHSGPVVAGVVGVKKFQYDLWGDTVNTASRMESNGTPGKVNISQATYDLIKDDKRFAFEHRGKINAKGKGDIDMYFVERIA